MSKTTLGQVDVSHSPQRKSPTSSGDSERTIAATDEEQVESQQPKPIDDPPDGGYGWVCVGCAFAINAHTWGLNSVGDFRRSMAQSC